MKDNKEITKEQSEILINTLKNRFENNRIRHKDLKWFSIQEKLEANTNKLWSLQEMERTGGEPDVVGYDNNTNEFLFIDCAPESPTGRRSVCYDREGLESRKEFKPENTAVEMANNMGITLLTEEEYRYLQQFGKFDAKTSSWIQTPPIIRKLGGAIFADCRYDTVFVYHNGAGSYCAARGFRGLLRV